ncbi:MAG: RIP metalloprotease RseP [Muribaculaceae bacterium]|nr:RIP metalloprotease RseP [Muribaculaceae bacterium]
METFLIKAAQLVVALAFLVIIHEFGHYIIARAFGIKVEKFYLFFNPWFSIAKWKPKKKKIEYDKDGNEKASWRDTEYGIGWLPLGGYVKIAGMIDESMDKEQLAKEPQPWEFRSKEAYKRLLVMLGGVIFNFILAIVIYAGIAWHWGNKYIPLDQAYEGMEFVDAAKEVGFRDGDIPLTADGEKIDASKGDYMYHIAAASEVKVLRNHTDTVSIAIPSDFILKLNDSQGFMYYRVPVFIGRLQPGDPADKAGMKEGDRIVAVNDTPTPAFTELTQALLDNAGKESKVTVERNGKPIVLDVTPSSTGKLGFQLMPLTDIYPTVTVRYNIFESVPQGWKIGTGTLSNYVGSMKYVFTSDGAKSIGGFGAIGNMFPEKWNWYSFWQITAFLSVALAFMNIIPIPGLDGGHVMFLLYEVITRRKPSEKVMEYAQYAGMAFLLLLLVYANGMDIFRAVFK